MDEHQFKALKHKCKLNLAPCDQDYNEAFETESNLLYFSVVTQYLEDIRRYIVSSSIESKRMPKSRNTKENDSPRKQQDEMRDRTGSRTIDQKLQGRLITCSGIQSPHSPADVRRLQRETRTNNTKRLHDLKKS